ncbi:hypothetical protein FHR32_000076 [Streptosporangium album]|uniref:Uncharacterized protein n=1 Tax=Streptosporangium album TaxID=47479 RepID=A0A7W7RQM7_9ACTN|nr:hypothetical protein [Streptosporangium album]MBB4935771.1 hypothetical protein [Streptosporangium album]
MAVLGFFGVSARDMVCFGAYVALGLTLPGLLLIRALYGGRWTLAEEIALGLVLGYAIEVLTYIAARAAGVPLLVTAWPIITYVVFTAVPRLRRHWKGAPRPTAPIWWSWSLALVTAYLVAWSATRFFKLHALTWPAFGTVSLDIPFHLALIGELKHHMPPTVPMIAGEPLFYHWFVYAHFAAASWITGVEPLVLLFRLVMLPMMVAFAVLIGMIGRRVVGSWPAALLATAGALFLEAPNLYLGTEVGAFTWRPTQTWQSPTQTFGALLFTPVVLLLVDLLDRRRSAPGKWLLLAVFLVAVTGAKATYLPLLAVGLIAIALMEAARHRRMPWPALVSLGITTVCFAYAQFILFGQARLGMTVEPLAMMRNVWGELTGQGEHIEPPLASALGITLLYLLSWVIGWCGICGLLSRPRLLMRPAVVLMLSIGAAGIGATLLFGHPHHAERYFSVAVYPYLGIVAVYGIFIILRRARIPLRATACAAGAAIVVTCLIRMFLGVQVPLTPGQDEILLYRPYIVLAVLALLATSVLFVVNRQRLVVAGALTISMIAAAGLPAACALRVLSMAVHTPAGGSTDTDPAVEASMVPRNALTAGRWLRAHSDPDDLVATNTHCRWGYENPCDSREFWGAALTERRMLVEGWAFTPTNYQHWRRGLTAEYLPFWDQERIQLNDAAFRSPSTASIQRLRVRYGVRWLFVDERYMSPGNRIGDAANLRFRSGDYAVYQVPGGTT